MISYDEEEEAMVVICDKCGEEQSFVGMWVDCIKQARTIGWVILKARVAYEHYCGECKSWD